MRGNSGPSDSGNVSTGRTAPFHGGHEIRCVQRQLLLETLAKELPSGTIRYSSKVVSIEESGFYKLVHLADGTILKTKADLEAAKIEIQMWHSSFLNKSFIPFGISLEPKFVIDYLQTLKSSEESLREQLEKAKKNEAAFIVTFAKWEQEIAELRSAVRELKAQLKPPSL